MRIDFNIEFSFWWQKDAKWLQLVGINDHYLFYIGHFNGLSWEWEYEFFFHKAFVKVFKKFKGV